MTTQFAFLQLEFPEVHDAAHRAEAVANSDPRAACFYARRALEIAVAWVYEHDGTLSLPYREDLSALIHASSFRNLVGQAVFYKCRAIKDLGNHAVHSQRPVTQAEAVAAVRELFHVCYWLARTYAKGAKPVAGTTFDPLALPAAHEGPKQSLAQLQELNARLASEREKALAALAERDELDEALKQARAELEAIKKANAATPDSHNYSEAETRDLFIDLLLKEAGWALDKPEDREYEVAGMPNAQNKGFVDYVLWGDDGKPLGVVEAKRTRRDPREGMHQAKLYADCLEAKFGQRPIVFATNGYEHWMWDDAMYPPRAVQGFYKKPELELLIQRRQTRRSLASGKIDAKIVERYYQTRAIRRVGEAFEKDRARRALLVMATGSGKTRTVIALADLLMRANWAKRILFLADRTALVNQAVNAFKRHLPDAAPVNLVTEKNTEGRVYVSTYPTMIGLIDEGKGGERRFGVGHFDLVVIDEAHRSVFMKYGAIFDYFDSLLVGLTATPKDEVGRNTYRLFELEDGVPTDVYSLNEAVADGYLVPARSVSVPLKLPATGIVYDQLSEEEKEQFELTDWKERAEDVLQDRRVDAPAINQWLFNRDTVDKVLKHLMERGLKVDGGDKLGKTIIFAKNHDHAVFIAERFDKNYPKYAGRFAKVIDFKTEYAQSLIDDFSNPGKLPQIAISVDMLDTGIDVPEVVNLVFFKQVRSKTKFWQMVGRGTRLCPDLFGPGQNKECFYIFDYCGNLEFFGQQMDGTDGASGDSLSKRLFAARLKLLAMLSHTKEGARRVREATARYSAEPETDEQVLASIVELLKAEVGAMNTDNFIVRAKRRLVEKYQNADVWLSLDEEKVSELEHEIAGLPSETEPEAVESKRFDLLILRLQHSVLAATKGFDRMKRQVQEIAALLEESSSIPVIRDQLALIQELQSEDWWTGVTVPMLETVRLRLRDLVKLVEHRRGSPVFTDFGDELGEESEIALPGFVDAAGFERFKEKARAFLRDHQHRGSIQRLRLNEPLTQADLEDLERVLIECGAGGSEIQRASEAGLGLFVRSIVGLDREAAKRSLNAYLGDRTLSATQIEFTNMIVDYLTEHGVMEPRLLFESPFTDLSALGVDGLFGSEEVDSILKFLSLVRDRAISVA
ncbi:MAG: DEAD/DEAH box helicase family protein [Nitrospirae bacterium]|nr:DEAD/DEAH box helicase family protein [Fimbriimonadaceae bacterium]